MADAIATGDPAVQDYLHEFPFLQDLLPKIQEKVREHFGQDARVRLEIVPDPEAPSERDLFALITSSVLPDDAQQRLAAFDEEWWLDAMVDAQGRLTVDLAP